MADDHVVYRNGAKEIAFLQRRQRRRSGAGSPRSKLGRFDPAGTWCRSGEKLFDTKRMFHGNPSLAGCGGQIFGAARNARGRLQYKFDSSNY